MLTVIFSLIKITVLDCWLFFLKKNEINLFYWGEKDISVKLVS